jgi:biotin carboxylase
MSYPLPQEQPVAVIVDGYSTGNFLPVAFARLGVQVTHVQSTPELIPFLLEPNFAEYLDNFIVTGEDDAERVIERARALDPVAVLAGQEPGVPMADLISERLGLASNGSSLSSARRDKYRMIEALRAAGVRCARQFKSNDPAHIVGWAGDSGYPVVVKPLSSASTDNVYICRTPGDVSRAARTILAADNVFGLPNTEALVQSYLPGTEYIVDTVSADGQRFVCGVWEYEKQILPSGKNIYDRDVLLAPDTAPVPELIGYVDTVLDALNIRHGPAHAEVIRTDDGPALVELGARLNGNMNPAFHDACLGVNQAGLTALAYSRPGEFRERYAGRVYTKLADGAVHNTSTQLDGIVDDIDQAIVDKITALPTAFLVRVKLKPGGRIRPTVDLGSSPLRVFMIGSSPGALRADHHAISLLKERVYRLRPASAAAADPAIPE